jgi:hypothetical protein
MTPDVSQLLATDLRLGGWAILAAVLLVGPVALVGVRRSGFAGAISWHVKATHLLPAIIQLSLFAYWGLYYRQLETHIPGIALQLLLAFLLDALLSWARYGKWRAGFGPVPLVLSLNLFAIFLHGALFMSLLAVSFAVLSKHLVRRTSADGSSSHIFNPSGFGIAVVALLNITWPALGDGDIAHEFNLPPNMAELIVLLALVVQTRVPVVLITLGATLAMLSVAVTTGYGGFAPQWSPVTLVIVLLMTDPATSARTPGGKVLFGLLAGFAMQAMACAMPAHPDFFYAKVLPIPLCNLAAPSCDRLAARVCGQVAAIATALDPRRNLAHVALWLAVFCSLVVTDKRPQLGPDHPEPVLHAFNRTPHLKFGTDGNVHCGDNPVFCAPFSFVAEARLWWE